MRRWLLLAPISLLAIGLPLCASPQQVPADHAERLVKGTDLFRKEVRAILTDKCLACHGGEMTRSDFDMSSRESLLRAADNDVAGKANERIVVPFDHKMSKLF